MPAETVLPPAPAPPWDWPRRRRLLLWPACIASALLHLLGAWLWRGNWAVPELREELPVQLSVQDEPTIRLPVPVPAPGPKPMAPAAVERSVLVPRSTRAVPVAPALLPAWKPPRPAAPPARLAAPIAAASPTPPRLAAPAVVAAANAAADHALLLERWLERHRRYPRAARRAGIEGEVRLRFELARGGLPRAVRIVRSSGAAVLDRAAAELLRRASPLPWPERLESTVLEVEVPVRYALSAAEPQR